MYLIWRYLKLNEMYSCILLKSGTVTIPAKVRTNLSIKEGNLVSIFIKDKAICICKKHPDESLNQCLVSKNGRIHIPVEIRKLLKIKHPSEFQVKTNPRMKEIFLLPVV